MPETCSMISWYLRKIPVSADLFVPFYRLFQLSVAFSMQRKTSARGDEGMCGEAMREGHDARGFGLHGRTTDAVGHGAALGPGEVEGDTALLRRLEVHGGVEQHGIGLSTQGGYGVAVEPGAMLVLTVTAQGNSGDMCVTLRSQSVVLWLGMLKRANE